MLCVFFQAACQALSSTIPAPPVPSSPAEKPPSIDVVEVTVLCTCFIVTLYQPAPDQQGATFPILVMQIIVSPGVEVLYYTVLSGEFLSLSMTLRPLYTRVLQPWH